MRGLRAACSFVSTLVLTGAAAAQTTVTIPDRVQCGECRIRLEPVSTIGASSGAELLSPNAVIRMDPAGNILLADANSYPGQLGYRAAGSSDWIFMGRQGKGPGEFDRAGQLWISPAGLHVIDMGTFRETLYSRHGKFIDTWLLPAWSREVAELDRGLRVHATTVRTRSAAGYPLHLLDQDRQIVRSFGADTAMLVPGMEILTQRVIAAAGDGGVWSARPNEYIIEKWSLAGQRLMTIRREADWFEPWLRREGTIYRVRPQPRIIGIVEDSDGLLWVQLSVADRNWEAQTIGEREAVTPEMWEKAVDTLVEVIDPARGVVLARARSPNVLTPIGPVLVSRTTEAVDGSARVAIMRLRLTRPSKR